MSKLHQNWNGLCMHVDVDRVQSASCTGSIRKAQDAVDKIYHTRWDMSKSLILKRTETQKGMSGENESPAAVKNHKETSMPYSSQLCLPQRPVVLKPWLPHSYHQSLLKHNRVPRAQGSVDLRGDRECATVLSLQVTLVRDVTYLETTILHKKLISEMSKKDENQFICQENHLSTSDKWVLPC